MTNNKEPNPFIRGDRCYLRELRLEDAKEETYYRWMNDPEITQFLESRFFPNSLSEIGEFVNEVNRDSNSCIFAVIESKEDRHIGNVKIGPINWFHRNAEIGILIGDKNSWGKGFASEVLCLMVQYARGVLNLHKLTAGCYANNIGSLKAFKKAGFSEEGTLKEHYFFRGEYVDAIRLGIVLNK